MPDHPEIIRSRQPARRARCEGRRSTARMMNTVVFDQISRETITAALIAAAWPISVAADRPASPSRIFGQLQPDQDEQERVEQELQDLPERVAREPLARGGDLRRPEADVDPRRHGREHAGAAEPLGRHVGRVARQQRDRGLDHDVVEPPPDLGDDPAGREADGDAPDAAGEELPAGVRDRERAADRADRHLVGDERRAVVEQPLALEHRDDPPRDAEAAGDRASPRSGRSARRSRRA